MIGNFHGCQGKRNSPGLENSPAVLSHQRAGTIWPIKSENIEAYKETYLKATTTLGYRNYTAIANGKKTVLRDPKERSPPVSHQPRCIAWTLSHALVRDIGRNELYAPGKWTNVDPENRDQHTKVRVRWRNQPLLIFNSTRDRKKQNPRYQLSTLQRPERFFSSWEETLPKPKKARCMQYLNLPSFTINLKPNVDQIFQSHGAYRKETTTKKQTFPSSH